MTKIAVYGTLRKGFSNHRVLGDSKLIGSALTKDKYKMTASGIPYVNPDEPLSNIKVEVYEVSDEQLPIVDSLEGYNPKDHNNSWYKRTPIKVIMEDNKEEIEASIYFCKTEARNVIESGDFADYSKY